MERVYAFTDESGNFGWDLSKNGVSVKFIVSSIIVKEGDLDNLRNQVEGIRRTYFQTGEMKSSGIGKNHERRKGILADLLHLPFNIFAVVISKEDITQYPGLHYKKSFYKFMNNIVHKELRKAFKVLTIVADEIGGTDYMRSFSKYVAEREDIPNLLSEADFFFEKSHNDVLIQLADLISGTLSHQFDKSLHDDGSPDYYRMLRRKIIRIEYYPKKIDSYILENNALIGEFDKDIAELCFRQAKIYIDKNENKGEPDEEARVATVKYLLFKFMNENLNKYTPTSELRNQLEFMEIGKVSTRFFRAKIIAKLRDSGVIIGSSSAGYKIPTKERELYEFININNNIIMPILHRLKICRDLVKLGTSNELDLFDNTEYRSLQRFFDDLPLEISADKDNKLQN